MPQAAKTFKKRVTRTVALEYLLYLPQGYDDDQAKRWPLVLFLHGAGERGSDLNKVRVHGIPRVVEQEKSRIKAFPFIAVSPQCPAGSRWTQQLLALSALLDEIEATHRVDADRVYVTGLSMGGYGTFALAAAEPQRFAAIVPVCGGGQPSEARSYPHVPAWVFHGAKDEVVPLANSADMVQALARAGGSPRFTVYPDAKHDSWTATYNDPDLYKWLMAQRRVSPASG